MPIQSDAGTESSGGWTGSFDVEHRLYGASDLVRVVTGAGFADVRCFGGLDGSPYDHTAKRLALVATKPGGAPR